MSRTDGIAEMSADGSSARVVVRERGGGVVGPLRWSPDGRKLVFTLRREGLTGRLYVVEAGGAKPRRITRPKYEDDLNPAWSPDGRELVFDAQGDGWTDLRVVDSDGSGEHKLATGSYVTGNPARVAGGEAWSPNGQKIAYFDRRGFPALMNADGSGGRRLKGPACEPDVDAGGISWSSNGRELLYDAGRAIAVVNADGTGLRNTLPRGRFPVWSPDGSKVAFQSYGAVFVANGDGKGVHMVGQGFQPSWSPDGRWLVYARFAGPNGDLYVVRPDGSGERRLTDTPASEADPVWSEVDQPER
jgi:Tol biopolymer transport system component